MTSDKLLAFVNEHPVVATVLAFPCVVTVCFIVLSFFVNFSFQWKR